ncbi:oligosaccharide flippase family protein [Sphingomonas piscis]|nr:oligosaccharide flippase family protein [Sphingomonas piscis]
MFTVTKLLNWAAGNVDRIVVGKLLGASALRYYSRASSLMLTLNQLLGTGAMRVLFSTFSRMQDDRARLTSGFDRALSTGLIGSTLASVFVVMFADLIVDVLLGPGWQSATPLMQALFAAFVARSGYVVAEAVPLALGLGRQSAVRQAIHLVLVCAGAVTGARYALVGAAVGIAIAYWIFYLICLGLVMRLIDVSLGRLFRIHSSALLVALPPGVIAAGAAWLLGPGQSLMLRLVPPLLFGAIAVFMIAFGPASLLSQDLARIRQTAIGHIRSRLARQGRAAV